jgi:hypothetical protein
MPNWVALYYDEPLEIVSGAAAGITGPVAWPACSGAEYPVVRGHLGAGLEPPNGPVPDGRLAWPRMGGGMSRQALKGRGQSAAGPLLPTAARPLAVAIVAACVVVMAVQGVWIRHGMEIGWLDTAVDAKVRAGLGGHPILLAVLVWPGAPVAVTAMTAALVLACLLRRRYGEAALVAISVPLATAITELVLKPLIGRTSWGDPFPSGHVTSVVALATRPVLAVALPADRRALRRDRGSSSSGSCPNGVQRSSIEAAARRTERRVGLHGL